MTVLAQLTLDTPPAPFTLGTSPVDIFGSVLEFEYPDQAVVVEAELPWLRSSVPNQVCSLYVLDAATSARQYGQPTQVPMGGTGSAARNFCASVRSPAFTALRDTVAGMVPMEPGVDYAVKLAWAFSLSAQMAAAWAPGTEFFGHMLVRTA